MAFTALATSNTTIGPSQYADMTSVLTTPFKVDGPNDLYPSYRGNTVSVQPGAAFAAGTRLRSTATETVTVEPQTAGLRFDAIVVRIDWSNPAPKLVAVKGTSSTIYVNPSTTPDVNRINRIPGVMYDALIAVVRVTSTGINNITDFRVYGGDGGPYVVSPAAMSSPNFLDARKGTWIATDQATETKRLDADGVWRNIGSAANPWRDWTPTIRYWGKNPVTGAKGGTVASLGTGGKASGRYRVVDGILDGFVSITTAAGNQFGTGALTFDLPLPCADWQPDIWIGGHIYTSTANGGDGNFDWPAQALIKADWNVALMFAPAAGDYSDMKVHMASWTGGPGEGVPRILRGWSVGAVYFFKVSYPVLD